MDSLRISRTDRLSDPFVTAGDRAYLVGAQDGSFPDRGWHVEGEMGGLWAHPIKLLDGFSLAVDGEWLPPASRFVNAPFWNAHQYELPDGLVVQRRQFVPDGIAGLEVRYSFRSESARRVALRFVARTDLQSVWGSDLDGIVDGQDEARYDVDLAAWICRDTINEWTVVVGGQGWTPAMIEAAREPIGPESTRGNGISISLDVDLTVDAHEERDLVIVIAGSHQSPAAARQSFLDLRDRSNSFWFSKMTRYGEMLEKSAVATPDSSINAAWDWLKCDNDWLVRDVPDVGRALGAGLDDYPWWFGCDNSYAALGCLALGQHVTAVETLDLVRVLSERANGSSGRVFHESNTRGRVVHPGCTQETPHYTCAVWETFRWTGDLEFLRRTYDFCTRGVLGWTLDERCVDGDMMPYGYGIIEVAGLDLQCVDTATHTVNALAALAEMARILGDEPVATQCDDLHAKARGLLEQKFWLEGEGLYADMLGTPHDMVPRLSHLLEMNEQPVSLTRDRVEVATELQRLLDDATSDPEQTQKRAWLLKNWTVICPVVEGVAEPERAVRVLERAESPEFSGPWGMYLSGIDRTHQMSINTGALAFAEIRYGRADQGLSRIRLLTETLHMHMPGAISEMSPDYGCFVQAWSAYAVAWPVVRGFFGIQPDAHLRRLTVRPCFPSDWNEARLENVHIGSNVFDFDWDGTRVRVVARDPGWSIDVHTPERMVQHADT